MKFRPGLPETFHRVKWKIMLPFMILTALFALFATKNITELVSTSLDDRQQSRLVDAARYASDAIARRERDQIDNIRTLAFTQGMPEAVGSHDAKATAALAAPSIANAGVEFAAVVDADGNVLFGTVLRDRATLAYGPPQPGLAATDWAIVRNVLADRSDARGDKWAEVVALGDGPYLMTAGPDHRKRWARCRGCDRGELTRVHPGDNQERRLRRRDLLRQRRPNPRVDVRDLGRR